MESTLSARLLAPSDESFFEESVDKQDVYIDNVDHFLIKVYNYFLGKGFLCIVVSKILNLLTLVFIVALTTFLVSFVDYDLLISSRDLVKAVDFGRSVHPLVVFSIVIIGIFWLWQLLKFFVELKDALEMRYFYSNKLYINESELDTIRWSEVVEKLIKVPRLVRAKERLTPLDIANRIMRKENYMIALINKEVLNLHIFGRPVVPKTLEWSIHIALFNYLFDQDHLNMKRNVLDRSQLPVIATGLRRRFRILGLVSLVLAPFLFVFLIVYFFFRYGEEIRNKPSMLGSREWSSFARWKFREFNELPHSFQRRLNASQEPARKYILGFASNLVTIIARFVSFVVGSVVLVLLLLAVWDEQVLFDVELLGKSGIWYVGILGTILATARSVIPDDSMVFNAETIMESVAMHTHYLPKSWKAQAHSMKVYNEFSDLYEYRVVGFLLELLSVLFAPFILLFALPAAAEGLVQFFQDFTTNVEGVGNVCKFAVFMFDKLGNPKYGAPVQSEKQMQSKHGKMEKSFISFKEEYPTWEGPADGEQMVNMLSSAIISPSASSLQHPLSADSISLHALHLKYHDNLSRDVEMGPIHPSASTKVTFSGNV